MIDLLLAGCCCSFWRWTFNKQMVGKSADGLQGSVTALLKGSFRCGKTFKDRLMFERTVLLNASCHVEKPEADMFAPTESEWIMSRKDGSSQDSPTMTGKWPGGTSRGSFFAPPPACFCPRILSWSCLFYWKTEMMPAN
ncbi:hypothetical protein LINPERPRIM_LOCUS15793 [Linum perenne]